MRLFSALTLALFLGQAHTSACLWDRDTAKDDDGLTLGGDELTKNLVLGKVPHHGKQFYETRIGLLTAKPELTFLERNDLAVAYLRVGQAKTARTLLESNLEAKPGDYYTMSNLGVLCKKEGDYKQAADFIGKALGIKPGGHMGLGDWYQKMLVYRDQFEDSGTVPKKNFLGQSYDEVVDLNISVRTNYGRTPMTAAEKKEFEKLQRLLANDQTFADGFLVMGDHLRKRGDARLALISYRRAAELGHDNEKELQRRQSAVLEQLTNKTVPFSDQAEKTEFQQREIAKASIAITEARAWLEIFQGAEMDFYRKHDKLPIFALTYAFMGQELSKPAR